MVPETQANKTRYCSQFKIKKKKWPLFQATFTSQGICEAAGCFQKRHLVSYLRWYPSQTEC